MNKSKNTRGARIFEGFKSFLLAALLVSLIVLVVLYIQGMSVYKAMTSDGGEAFDMLWSVQGGTAPVGLDSSRLVPEVIGYKQADARHGTASVGSFESASLLYEIIKPCLTELFGSDCRCFELEPEDGEALFAAARRSDEFVYLRYHQPVLYQLIYAFAVDSVIVSESDVASGNIGSISAYISEIVIIPDKDLAAHRFVAYARDNEGNYFEFRPGEHIVNSVFYISKLADSGAAAVTYDFTFTEESERAHSQPTPHAELVCTRIESKTLQTEALAGSQELLRLFGYNPDKLDGYADASGQVYIDSHSRLRIDGTKLHFTADGDSRGLKIDSLLGYSASESPTLYSKLTAADNLVRRLTKLYPTISGGDGRLCLGDVYMEDSMLAVEYILTYDNIRVGSEPHIKILLADRSVREVSVSLTHIDSAMETDRLLMPEYVLEKLILTDAIPEEQCIYKIALRYEDGTADWYASSAK